MSDERVLNYSNFLLPLNSTRRHGLRRILTVLILSVPPVHKPATSFFDFTNTLYPGNSKYIFQMDFLLYFFFSTCQYSFVLQCKRPSFTPIRKQYLSYYANFGTRIYGTQARTMSLSNRRSGSNTAHCPRENKILCFYSTAKFYSTQYSILFSVTYESLFSSLSFKTLLTVSLVFVQAAYISFINIQGVPKPMSQTSPGYSPPLIKQKSSYQHGSKSEQIPRYPLTFMCGYPLSIT